MIKLLLLYALAGVFAVLAAIGLLVPVLPGVAFLLLAAVCVSFASPRAHASFSRHPSYRRFRRRWEASEGLHVLDRGRLACWLTVEAAFDSVRRAFSRR